MHYKNGREAKVGDWVIGKTHNSGERLRVGYVKELMPEGGTCNVKMHVWLSGFDYCGGESTPLRPYETRGEEDYAYTANLTHVLDGHQLVSIVANAWKCEDYLGRSIQIDG